MDEHEAGLHKLQQRSIWAKAVIIAYVAITALSFSLIALAQYGVVYDAFILDWDYTWYEAVDLVALLIMLASYIIVSMWIFQGHKNIHRLEYLPLEFTPGWAIGWFAIPIASVWKPFQAMKELWNASTQDETDFHAPATGLLWVWWIAWLLGGIATFPTMNTELILIATAGELVAAICLLIIIERITEGQSSFNIADVFA